MFARVRSLQTRALGLLPKKIRYGFGRFLAAPLVWAPLVLSTPLSESCAFPSNLRKPAELAATANAAEAGMIRSDR